jgi:hypothetical protein
MSDSKSPDDPAHGLANGKSQFTITFQPFTAAHQAALAPNPALGIVRATLTRIGHRWHNAFNEVTIRKADDLFACAAQDGAFYDLVPKGAEITELTLELQFAESPEPHLVELKAQHGVMVQDPRDLERVLPFLVRRGFVLLNSSV